MIKRFEDAVEKLFLGMLPGGIRRKLMGTAGFPAIFRSILHLGTEKGLRLSVGLFTYAWVVRHLGPVEYGKLSWVLNFVTVFVPLIQYGLDEIVTRDLVRAKNDEQKGRVLWTALGVRGLNAVVGIAAMLVVVRLLRPGEGGRHLVLLVSAYSLAYIMRALEVWDLLFQSQLDMRRLTFSRNASYVLTATLKALGVWFKRGVGYFVFLSGFEYFCSRLFIFLSYRRELRALPWAWDGTYARSLWREAFPPFLAIALTVLNDRLAVLMLEQLSNDRQVGLYYSAAGLIEIWVFLPTALAASLFPALVRAQGDDANRYARRAEQFGGLMLWTGIGLAAMTGLAAGQVVPLLFGDSYASAVSVLTVIAWIQPFTAFHVVRMKLFTLQRQLGALALGAGCTLLLNGLLLWQWCPSEGADGAARAVVLAAALGPVLAAMVSAPQRASLGLFLRALAFPLRLR